MHALTLHQPWATLIASWPELDAYVAGGGLDFRPKRVENRDWPPPEMLRGQVLAIHAGKAFDDGGHAEAMDMARKSGVRLPHHSLMPMGEVVAVARVVGVFQRHATGWSFATWTGEVPSWAPATPQDVVDRAADFWLVGPYGWALDGVRRLATPIPCRGAQKIWRLPADVATAVEAQLQVIRVGERG